MRRLFVLSVSLALALVPARAGFVIDSYKFATCTPPSFAGSYVTNAMSGSNATSYTFTSVSLGATDCTRMTVVSSGAYDTGGNTPTVSTTVGGNSTTERIQVSNCCGNAVAELATIDSSALGTTADIVVTVNTTAEGAGITVWRILNPASHVPTSTGGSGTDPEPLSASLTIPAGGFGIGYVFWYDFAQDSNTFTSWNNLTEQVDALIETNFANHSGASSSTSGTSTRSASDGGMSDPDGVLVLGAWDN